MEEKRDGMPATRVLLTLASLVIVIAGLKAAQTVLIPVLLALLLAILATPAVSWLRRRRLPTGLAVLIVVVALLGIFIGFGTLFGFMVMPEGFTPWTIMIMAPGAFFMLSIYVWIIRSFTVQFDK